MSPLTPMFSGIELDSRIIDFLQCAARTLLAHSNKSVQKYKLQSIASLQPLPPSPS